ncbi:hypothetical protein AAII07_13135 [Microvirga sp. 0TCS3.31]
MQSVLSVISGTPLWVWGILVLIVYLGMTAMRPGRRSPARLSLVPGIFLAVALGTLLHSAHLADILPLWLAGCLLGLGIGATWAMVLRIGIDRTQGLIHMPGTAFWLVTGLILFGMRYAIEVSMAFNRDLVEESLRSTLPYAVAGLGTGMSAGWWIALMLRYFRPTDARPAST